MTHTPGPWQVGQSGSHHVAVYPNDGRLQAPICFCGRGADEDHEEFPNAEANARLIAAAPDLLEALEMIRDSVATQASATAATIRTWADTAIAKAKGEAE